MNTSQSLREGIDQFELHVNGYSVMPVYWITDPGYADGFMGAKGTPEDMQGESDRITLACEEAGEGIGVYDEESARNFLYRNHIGIDCSAFVFHLLDKILKSAGKGTYLDAFSIPREELIAASARESWRVAHILTEEEGRSLPPRVPLTWVCETFQKDPASQVNVARICSDVTSSLVNDITEAQPGDLIKMSQNGKSKHVAIITETDGSALEIWDSYRENAGYGGVMSHEIKVCDTNTPLGAQLWSNFDTSRYSGYEIRRPVVLV